MVCKATKIDFVDGFLSGFMNTKMHDHSIGQHVTKLYT